MNIYSLTRRPILLTHKKSILFWRFLGIYGIAIFFSAELNSFLESLLSWGKQPSCYSQKKDSDKQYAICSPHHLRLEVKGPERSTKFFFFAILHHKFSTERKTFKVLSDIFRLHIQNWKDPHKISFSEPMALNMEFSIPVKKKYLA